MSAPTFDPFLAERHHLMPGLALAHRMAGGGAWEVEAEGVWVTLSDGRRLLDLGSYGVTLFGHRHPAVVGAVAAQLGRLPTSTRSLANDVTPKLAMHLARAFGEPLSRCWFGCNGADAVDLALKLARVVTGRPRVVAATGGFHGKSLGALSPTWHDRYRGPFADHLAPATHVDATDIDALERELATGEVAATILEPIQGEGGVVPVPRSAIRAWSELSRAHGAHFIADEIQTGFGRCGPLSLAVDLGARPSAVLLGKSLGGGVAPISAVVGTDGLFAPLVRDPFLHSSTFGGHPLGAAAALGALDALAAIKDRSAAIEAMLICIGIEFASLVTDVRGRGYLWGLEIRDVEAAGVLLAELAAAGVVTSPCLGRPEVIRLLFPAVISPADLGIAEDRIRAALDAATDVLITPLAQGAAR